MTGPLGIFQTSPPPIPGVQADAARPPERFDWHFATFAILAGAGLVAWAAALVVAWSFPFAEATRMLMERH